MPFRERNLFYHEIEDGGIGSIGQVIMTTETSITHKPETTHEAKAKKIAAECMQEMGNVPCCIDDRDLLNLPEGHAMGDFLVARPEFNGPQFLGGSLGVFALVAEWLTSQGHELTFDAIYNKTLELHQAVGLQLGVHMDDHHGEWTAEKLAELLAHVKVGKLGEPSLIPGCGFAGLLSREDNPLQLSPEVHNFFKANPNIVDEMVRRGAKLSILAQNHAPKAQAMAVENFDPTKTVDTSKALAAGVQTYNHDTGKLSELLTPLMDEGRTLARNNVWLKATTNILAGMDPVAINQGETTVHQPLRTELAAD